MHQQRISMLFKNVQTPGKGSKEPSGSSHEKTGGKEKTPTALTQLAVKIDATSLNLQ
jgi:hypothetical protein